MVNSYKSMNSVGEFIPSILKVKGFESGGLAKQVGGTNFYYFTSHR